MRLFLNPCPSCGAGKNDNDNQPKKEIKIYHHAPIKGIKKSKRGCWSITIKCMNCGYKVGPLYQRKEAKKIVESFSELKTRAADIWNHSKPKS